MIAWVDGAWIELDVKGGTQALLAVLDGRTGPGVFETMGAIGGELPLWNRHVARMEQSARRFGIPWAPQADLRECARETLVRNDEREGVLRMTLVPLAPARGRWLLVARRRNVRTAPLRLLPISDLATPHGPPRDVKCTARDLYDRALARASAAGTDDALLLDEAGRILETAVGNVFFRVEGRWHTPRADGSFLPGVGRAVLIDGLRERRTPAAQGDFSLDDLRMADSVVVTNAVYGPRAAAILGEEEPDDGTFDDLSRIWTAALGS